MAGLLANTQVFNPSPYQTVSEKWITAFRELSRVAYIAAEAMMIERDSRDTAKAVERIYENLTKAPAKS